MELIHPWEDVLYSFQNLGCTICHIWLIFSWSLAISSHWKCKVKSMVSFDLHTFSTTSSHFFSCPRSHTASLLCTLHKYVYSLCYIIIKYISVYTIHTQRKSSQENGKNLMWQKKKGNKIKSREIWMRAKLSCWLPLRFKHKNGIDFSWGWAMSRLSTRQYNSRNIFGVIYLCEFVK